MTRLLAYAAFVLVASCSSGGCSSCAGGAIHAIPGEAPLTPETRIPHAIQVRLTQQGLQSIQAIAPDLLGGFLGTGVNIPTTNSSTTGVPTLTVCPSGPCHLNVTLPTTPPPLEFGLVPPNPGPPATPGGINVKARVIIQGMIPIHACIGFTSSVCISTDFTITVDTTQGNYAYVGVETMATIGRDAHAPRLDYFRADLVAPDGGSTPVIETPGETIENADVNCSSGAACFIVNLLKTTIIGQVSSQFTAIVGPIQDQLADTAMPDPPGCPTGTTVSGTYCHYADNTQVPRLLGTQGTGDFGALVSRFTPGLHALDSYNIAAGDHMHDSEVAANGMTLDMFGAFVSGQHSTCVPQLANPGIPTVPEWTTLRQNLIPGTSTETDLGIGVSEEFFNSTLWNFWDSGLFCLGITTRLSQSLSTGLFGALPQLSSLRNVVFPAHTAPVALTLRPQQPPTAHIGTGSATDPLIMLTFTNLDIDFYAFSEERYIRFMTVNTNLSLPISLMTSATGIVPSIGMATATNTTVTNSSLLTATPTSIASLIGPLLGTAIGMFANGLPAVNLPSIPLPGSGGTTLGTINIQIPASGIQGLSEGSSRFLGLFANLQYTHGAMDSIALDTTATLQRLPFDPSVYQFGPTFTVDQLPHVVLTLSTPNSFGHDVEYSYQVDDGTWSLWSRETSVNVVSQAFIAQGSHHIDVRARIVDEPGTVDRDPARVSFTIDTVAPTAVVERQGDALHITAEDNASDVSRLEYNVVFDDRTNDTWTTQNSAPIPTQATHYVVRVRDENGNESRYEGPILQQVETIRGGPTTDVAAGACGCSTPGARNSGTGGMLAAVGGLLGAIAFLRRRRERVGSVNLDPVRARTGWLPPRLLMWGAVLLFFTGLGCDCSSNNHTDGGVSDGEAGVHCSAGQQVCAAMNSCVPSSATCTCPEGQMAQGTAHFNAATCTWDNSAGAAACNCQWPAALSQGMAGSHLDMAIASDNSVWFSSYSAGDPRPAIPYGDLVVGKYNTSTSTVAWTNVDGVPSGPVTNDPTGWRGGVSAPGDDVGRWNSIQLDAADHPRVAYWDTTHDQLKYAYSDGSNWSIAVVDTNGHNGRYASLVILPGGFPAIAYRATVTDSMGRVTAQVRYAISSTTTPRQASDWTISNIATAASTCRAADCATGQVCQQSTGTCIAPSGTCTSACSATQACVASACVDLYTSTWIEDYPPGIGLFTSMVLDHSNHPQLVYYDRDRGNLMGISGTSSTAFGTPFIIDGEAADHSDLGDRGMWSSLAVTADGTWHIAYVDAWNETVLYTTVTGGTPAATPQLVDDGSGIAAAMPFSDGHHIIGDSLAIDVSSAGAVRIVYQDSTAGAMRLAEQSGTMWTLSAADTMNSTGYWSRIRGGSMATFWRDLSMTSVAHFGVRVFAVH